MAELAENNMPTPEDAPPFGFSKINDVVILPKLSPLTVIAPSVAIANLAG